MNNGASDKKGLLSNLSEMLSDQAELAALELRYESRIAARRFLALVLGSLFALGAFAIAQVVFLHVLVSRGMSWLAATGLLFFLDTLAAYLILRLGGRRNPRAGQPFEGSKREAKENLEWIQKLFS